jgi:hypothetical protein
MDNFKLFFFTGESINGVEDFILEDIPAFSKFAFLSKCLLKIFLLKAVDPIAYSFFNPDSLSFLIGVDIFYLLAVVILSKLNFSLKLYGLLFLLLDVKIFIIP